MMADNADAPKDTEGAAAVIATVEETRYAWVELYDSGETCHISPYCNDFETYLMLDPSQYLHAANKQQFHAVSTGQIHVSTPNGHGTSELMLDDVLHAPSITYTLVSLRMLYTQGYCIEIGGGHMDIFSPEQKLIAHIPQTLCSLYQVSHEEEVHTVEVVSMMELHQCMGHIAPTSAHKLVEEGLVTGIALDPASLEEHCPSCVYAHLLHQSILKVCVSEQALNFGGEMHTNVWGPTTILTCGGCQFFITFMDDVTCFTVVYLLPNKGDALNCYRSFQAWACTQHHCAAIHTLCSN